MKNHFLTMERPAPETNAVPLSLFGQNLEHTRSCISGGLSAQLLRNRKFCGKPSRSGVAAEWTGFGEDVFYELPQGDCAFTRHAEGCEKMLRRNERSCQFLMHVRPGGFAGIAQQGLFLTEKKYFFKAAFQDKNNSGCQLRIEFRTAGKPFAAFETQLISANWEIKEFSFTAPGDVKAELRIGLVTAGSVAVGMVSLLPEDHWHGMRPDVVEHLREIGTSLIRWPGGNFAGEYRWRDGLLNVDERAPSQSAMEIETQPHTGGFDDNELGTDDVIELCRRIGAEPYFTINAMWETPESSAAWVEYCNGSPDTPMGKLRAERGYPEPFNVKFWSLGNEMGFAHMEGAKAPEEYAKMVGAHGRAMKAVSPEITLCSSGPLPDEEWQKLATAPLSGIARVASFHWYVHSHWDFSAPQELEQRFQELVQWGFAGLEKKLTEMCRFLPENMAISFDEWNLWYVWFRLTNPLDGLWTGIFWHWLLRNFKKYRIGCCCYFQAVNENAVIVHPRESHLSSIGQAMQLFAGHAAGEILPVSDDELFATRREDGSIYVTIVNADFHQTLKKELPFSKENAEITRLRSQRLLPGCEFAVERSREKKILMIELEPLSMVSLRLY